MFRFSNTARHVRVPAAARRFGSAQLQAADFIKPNVTVDRTQLLIDGQFVDAVSGKTFPTLDPRNEQVIANIAEAGQADVDRAVASSRKAFDYGAWPRMSGKERGKIMCKVADAIEQQADKLALLETWDNGKPLPEARFDVQLSADVFRYYGGWCDKIEGKTTRLSPPNIGHIDLEPIGVCGIITPWNFPMQQVAVKLSPCLAAGNTAVIKPAETAPITTLVLAEILLECGVPEGTVNILQGFGETTGAAIVCHEDVDKLSFTGEAATGKIIMANAAQNLTPVTLELGGKSPIIVYDDANLAGAIPTAFMGTFFNAGQVCCATTRVYVQEPVYEEVLEQIAGMAKARKVGDPFAEGVEQGPAQNREVFEKVLKYLDIGKSQSRTVTGGNRIGDTGYFVEPTIFEVADNDKISREEVFGPCMAIAKFSDDEEVLARANDTDYGLAASVFSQDTNRLIKASRTLKAGSVWLNTYGAFDPSMPFGGYKNSGIGRDLGFEAIKAFTQVKTVVQNVGDPANLGPWL